MVPFASSFFAPVKVPSPAMQDGEALMRKKKLEMAEPKQPQSLLRQGKAPSFVGGFLNGPLFNRGVFL
jgi:hypothetical protein